MLVAVGEESRCGWLKDKYRLSWQIIPAVLSELPGDKDPARAAPRYASHDEDGQAGLPATEGRRRGPFSAATVKRESAMKLCFDTLLNSRKACAVAKYLKLPVEFVAVPNPTPSVPASAPA